jgi:hypothetical protein
MMLGKIRRAAFGAAFVAFAIVSMAACKRTRPCPGRFADLPAAAKAGPGECTCRAGGVTGSVWGTGIYTSDSSVCTAALHAGAVGPMGGAVIVAPAPGCSAYGGSTQNGVSSSTWGMFESSFYFPGHGTGACAGAGAGGACPPSFKQVPDWSTIGSYSCTCLPGVTGAVWGSGTYTADSSICAAATHAGAVGATGGSITVHRSSGCGAYTGSTQNGVTSGSWGSYDASFYFPGHGDGSCVPSSGPGATCPGTFNEIPNGASLPEFSCNCGPGARGAVWGSQIYTRDSNVCAAAVHAGAIPPEGGKIVVKAAPGCPRYTGTASHGVTTGAWGSYGGSFYLPGHGDGRCH